MRSALLLSAGLLATSLVTVPSAQAAWHVDPAQSTLSFVTAKAAAAGTAVIEEVQSFGRMGGSVGDDGRLSFDVDLNSVDTHIDIRDTRIKKLLFDVEAHPRARFVATVDAKQVSALPVGGSVDLDVDGALSLAGHNQPLGAHLRVVKLADGALLVSTRQPVLVDLADYGLTPGVDALRQVAKLAVVSRSAPVTFSVLLRQGR